MSKTVELPESQKADAFTTVVNTGFVKKAGDLLPTLHSWARKPHGTIKFAPDASVHFGLTASAVHSITEFETLTWGRGDEFTLDFGIHMVGHLSFNITPHGLNIDAPCRLRLTFGESPIDVTETMDDVQTWISTSWLPDEVVNIDVMPATIKPPRRYAFRYLRVQIMDTSPKYRVQFSDILCNATSAVAPDQSVEKLSFPDPALQALDDVSTFTLRDCMQTVFEDGPRRDRRLWLGDLRLQALVNYVTFKDYDLVKRNLYMFAALPRDDGSLPACVFEKPVLASASDYIVDYDVLFGAVVHDYVVASGDITTGNDLWMTIQGSLRCGLSHLDPETHAFDSTRSSKWKFLDWAEGLDTSAGLHGVLLYTLRKVDQLAALLSKAPQFETTIAQMEVGAQRFVSSVSSTPVIVSGPNIQLSLMSASWLALSSALPLETITPALLYALHTDSPTVLHPLTPYAWHHVAHALAHIGQLGECAKLLHQYWGGMVRAGATTFWECFDAKNARASPYGDVRNNSFCHAWSCTPAWLLRDKTLGLREHLGIVNAGQETVADVEQRWVPSDM